MIIEQKGWLCQCSTFCKINLPDLPSTIASTSLTCNDGEPSVYLVPGRHASQCTTEAEQKKTIRYTLIHLTKTPNQDILSISIFVLLLFPHEFSLLWSVMIEEKACFFHARLSLKSTYHICPAQLRRLLSLVMMVSLASTWSLVGKPASAQLKRSRRRQSDIH